MAREGKEKEKSVRKNNGSNFSEFGENYKSIDLRTSENPKHEKHEAHHN